MNEMFVCYVSKCSIVAIVYRAVLRNIQRINIQFRHKPQSEGGKVEPLAREIT
jgi:hypothetical protein